MTNQPEPSGILFPVFVTCREGGGMDSYESLAAMQKDLEEIDVENDEFIAWDAQGREVKLGVQEPIWLTLTTKTATRDSRQALLDAIDAHARDLGVPADLIAHLSEKVDDPVRRFESILAAAPPKKRWFSIFGRRR